MAFNFNPLDLGTADFTKAYQVKSIMQRLGDFLNGVIQFIQSPSSLASILNSNGKLSNTSLLFKSVDLGTVSTNQTVDCTSASGVAVHMAVNTAVNLTLTLSNLSLGVPVTVWFGNNGAGTQTFKVAATQPGGTAYSDVFWKLSTVQIDMTATGISLSPAVNVIAAGAAIPFAPNWYLAMVVN